MDEGYWRGAADDEAMQDEHGFIWQAMLETIGIDLAGRKVLDAGCNRGGFLRLLSDRAGIASGWGYDPATAAVEDARSLSGRRDLTFEAAATVPAGWVGFDVAFSHEVLYLLDDLPAHGDAVLSSLVPGGLYFAVMGVHSGSRLMSAWHAAHSAELRLPRLYGLDEVAGMFETAGFDVAVGRLRIRFVPVSAHRRQREERRDLLDWLDYYSRDKVMFRLTRPPAQPAVATPR